MPSTDDPNKPTRNRQPAWLWPLAALAVAILWVTLVRIPLVVNAVHHLDSDLAVDGLVLIEILQGKFRWHYPGTPYMGILPVMFSLPQTFLFGSTPAALVSGGVLAYVLVLITIFSMTYRIFGRSVALWGLIPLTFTSTGVVWLSGRITGGHLLAVSWHAIALLLFDVCLRRREVASAAWLGAWCGFGLYLDNMLISSVLAIVAGGTVAWLVGPASGLRGGLTVVAFLTAFAIGYSPRVIGQNVDPYDAYTGQFTTIFASPKPADAPPSPIAWKQARHLATEHFRLLMLECVPRLFAGHRLPGYQSEPSPEVIDPSNIRRARTTPASPLTIVSTWFALAMAVLAFAALTASLLSCRTAYEVAVRVAMLIAPGLVLIGFIVNRNIYNSDNYRYLALWLVPWSAGYGLLSRSLARRGSGGLGLAVILAVALSTLMTADTRAWYERFGWMHGWIPRVVPHSDPVLAWLEEHPEVDGLFGDYWDVYRLSLLTGGRVRGVPFPNYPDRFPEWSSHLPGRRPRTLLVRPGDLGPFYERSARRDDAIVLLQSRMMAIYDWPVDKAGLADGRRATK